MTSHPQPRPPIRLCAGFDGRPCERHRRLTEWQRDLCDDCRTWADYHMGLPLFPYEPRDTLTPHPPAAG